MGERATREGVQREESLGAEANATPRNEGAVDPNAKQPPKGEVYNPRAAAMDEINARRRAELIAEGVELPSETPARDAAGRFKSDDEDDDEDDDGSDAAAEAARAAAAATAATAAAKDAEVDPAKQLAVQTDDIALTPEQLKRTKFSIKVDGEVREISGEEALRRLQKDGAADKRLAEAVETKRQADAALAEANKKLAEANTAGEKKAAEKAVAEASAEVNTVATEFAEALYGGDQAKAVELFTKAVSTAVDGAMKGRGNATPVVDINTAVDQALQQRELGSALQALDRDYPEIRNDEVFARAADRERARLETDEGLSRSDAILKAGESVAKKYQLGKYAGGAVADGGRQDQALDATMRAKRVAAKEGIDDPRTTHSRASTTNEAPPADASETIRKIAASRGQQIG